MSTAASEQSAAILRRAISVLKTPSAPLPVVTLSWAQSSTGAIAAPDGQRVTLSGHESLVLTHQLRALHDAILVGVQTVFSDDPLLSVRLAAGPQPRPVVLDSHLRTPLTARMLERTDIKPWIFCSDEPGEKGADLAGLGATVIRVGRRANGLDLEEVLRILHEKGIASVMVEGGAHVLSSFLHLGLATQVIVTESPSKMVGLAGPGMPRLATFERETVGEDAVTWGMP
jgi:GTP cyclohydrolase II